MEAQSEKDAACDTGAVRLMNGEIAKFFKKQELIPAIIQEAGTGEVLMLAYMNEESLAKTLETGYTWFYSRSRQRLWQKGEESGHVQRVVSITGDCDDDTLLVKVEQTGPACHTGERTCFFSPAVYHRKG
jgi:phosphoribosyl-AMP cyclohydrolase/phosphoribosyl-ATP pyrophosphohydrolase/phosphoribosyl-AMP cyclohydrolase